MRLLPAFVLLLSACNATSDEPERLSTAPGDAPAVASRERGEELYLQHCSVCHGSRGRADGPAAPHLFPAARDFTSGRFRLVSSEDGAPADADLVATLRRGIPGSAMPAWGWLGDSDLDALAAHVRALAVEGLGQDLAQQAREDGERFGNAEARDVARERMTPNRPIEAPLAVRADAEALHRGERIYGQRCAQCHAADGKGEASPRFDEDGALNWARDFTAGFLKGGDSVRALTCRIRAGIPGTAMPPNRLEAEDEDALVAYVRSLIPVGTSERLVHTRSTLTARLRSSAPQDPDDPAWQEAESIRVVLAPLWWNQDAVLEARLAALHDGTTVALRLAWPDATGVVQVFTDARGSDGAALQFSDSAQPMLFGMGAPHEPTNLWHWQALRFEDVAGALDLFEPVAHASDSPPAGAVRADVPLYRRLFGRLEPSARADRITLRGIDSAPGAARVRDEVRANARWQDGEWVVVFRRSMRAADGATIALAPGKRVQIACAVWNGAAGDAGPRKSISIWQELRF